VKPLMAVVGESADVSVDLEAKTITDPTGRVIAFEINPFVRTCS